MYHRKSSRALQRQAKANGSGKQQVKGDKKADATAGFDHEEMGMTQERQRVIQASLFKMLGQADSAPSTMEGGTVSKAAQLTAATAVASKPVGI